MGEGGMGCWEDGLATKRPKWEGIAWGGVLVTRTSGYWEGMLLWPPVDQAMFFVGHAPTLRNHVRDTHVCTHLQGVCFQNATCMIQRQAMLQEDLSSVCV